MSHCAPCKSRLGTGGLKDDEEAGIGGTWIGSGAATRSGMIGKTSFRSGSTPAPAPVRPSETVNALFLGTGAASWQRTAKGAVWTGSRAALRRLKQRTPRTWIPAVTVDEKPPFYPYAVYTGGPNALVYADNVVRKRKVVAVRNGGVTGLEVRVGAPVDTLAFGTGCDTCELMGTGAEVGTGGQELQHLSKEHEFLPMMKARRRRRR